MLDTLDLEFDLWLKSFDFLFRGAGLRLGHEFPGTRISKMNGSLSYLSVTSGRPTTTHPISDNMLSVVQGTGHNRLCTSLLLLLPFSSNSP
ncbi:hypothetical protein RRG08_003845 [Elysia crispata]|uniref:Uncharacterized protein n=1 Tax=Elysia crispata TaxID=231223 RepID=A0AAE0ZDT8_9GAST|nr:hypothetical protein RRG08_003845 [Elysia crispata]